MSTNTYKIIIVGLALIIAGEASYIYKERQSRFDMRAEPEGNIAPEYETIQAQALMIAANLRANGVSDAPVMLKLDNSRDFNRKVISVEALASWKPVLKKLGDFLYTRYNEQNYDLKGQDWEEAARLVERFGK